MTKPTVTATDRLTNVMDVVELGRRTGLLRVERGAGTVREDGEVYFAQGKPVYAVAAGSWGREALRVLAHWGGCFFSFDTQAPQPIPNISGVLPTVSAPSNGAFSRSGPNGYTAGPGQSGQHHYNGANGFGASGPSGPRLQVPPPAYQPANQSGYQPGYSPATPNFGSSGAFSPANGSFPSDPNSSSWGTSGANGASQPNSLSQPNSASGANGYQRAPMTPFPATQSPSQPQRTAPAAAPVHPASHPLAGRRPKRATDVRDLINVVTKYNLARSHRTVLLLADGEHTVQDISRLSGKPVEDVVQLLRDLEERRLVQYPA